MGKIIKTGLLLFGLLSTTESRAAVWGDPTIENTIQTVGNSVSLNFGGPGVRSQIQLFLVNSNDPAGFHVVFTFANKGKFKSGLREIVMTSIILDEVSGILGTGLTPAADYSLTVDGTSGVATWTPAGTPSSATDNYLVAVYASWADPAGQMAGFYQESIVPTIVSGP